MTENRNEHEMAPYAEVAPSELSVHRADLPSIGLLIGLAAIAGAAFVLVGTTVSMSHTYLFLLAGMACLVGVCEVVGVSRRCRCCDSRLTSYENGDYPSDLVRQYFEVCEHCRKFSRYSRWDLA